MPGADGTLKKLLRAVRCRDPNARVILFCSRARGDYLSHSDYDLIVVSSRFEGVSFPRRAALLAKELYKRGVVDNFEFLCYTPEEFDKKKRD